MTDSQNPDFSAANEEREKRVIEALLDFNWGDYRLHDVAELAYQVRDELDEHGESDHMDWVRDLARVVIPAARPLTLADLSESDRKI